MTAIVDMPEFGHYQLLAEIGHGLRGPAFLARARSDGAAEALYLIELSAFATGEDQLLRTFVRDVDAAARIRHRNVVAIVERGANHAGQYVVMEYVECASLGELEERHRAIRPPRLVAATVIDALHGLHAAHAVPGGDVQPLTHGCISPDQLLIGLDGTCRISGFGYARPRVQTNPSHRSRSGTGYMAPEQLIGGEIDRRSDVFSMGVVLWNALTGKKLFHDRLDHATMSNVLERKVPRPSAIGLSPPPPFDAVVLKSLQRDPARRFQDAAEMAEALRDAARGAACLAGSTEVGEWITTTFGSELAARRRTIREIATRAPLPLVAPDVPVLPRLGASAPAESTTRDELSIDELARANEPLRRAPTVQPTLAPIVVQPISFSDPGASRHLALVALAAFSVVAGILGWRWWLATAPPDIASLESAADPSAAASAPAPLPIELEVTVLEVRPAVAVTPAAAPAPEPAVATEPVPPAASAPPATAAPPAASAPARTIGPDAVVPPSPAPGRTAPAPARPARKRATPARPAEARAEPPETRPAESRPEPPPPPPAKPEPPPRPALEQNPYLYK